MKHSKTITILVLLILVAAGLSAAVGIFSRGGEGPVEYDAVRGRTVTIHGYGVYKHMSADVAVQGIGQDYVTLFLGIPLLAVALVWARRGSLRGRLFLAGVLGYFLVTYLFYLIMGMYNFLFLVYAFLLGTTFFAFALTMLGFDLETLPEAFGPKTPVRFSGGFLVFNTFAIALMWLSVVLPPLLDGSLYPVEVQHYTTLIVQGMDLGLLLPLCFVSAMLLLKRRPAGYLLGTVYLVFLSLLMTALVAKIIAMGTVGANIIPAVFIIPVICLVTLVSAFRMVGSVKKLD
ncbi:MAG: hypothetical protein JW760_09325 [Spirochaetales bacterium]|nr:hypothetical protein [Spirochaetales bacterium]